MKTLHGQDYTYRAYAQLHERYTIEALIAGALVGFAQGLIFSIVQRLWILSATAQRPTQSDVTAAPLPAAE